MTFDWVAHRVVFQYVRNGGDLIKCGLVKTLFCFSLGEGEGRGEVH